MLWAAVAITVLAVVLSHLIAPKFIDEGPGIIVISLAMVGGISLLSVRNFTAPARALERRTPVGSELSKDEWQAKHFSTKSWLLLGSIFLVSTIICISVLTGSELQKSSDYFWAFGSGVISILGARALLLKHQLAKRSN
ncbi:hypothetical protein [Qipengyuania huizhouensis]|uniref:hypothetical protein n=1 Tax=Qipengyuania huizhouensis TaxID=2867245 RepID=UPI001C87B92D|nr:hypothetical protein [Qipengyuania huizhouensis]MBX7461784.1 hypothetical protein [Qipengyuania huizhouensis]